MATKSGVPLHRFVVYKGKLYQMTDEIHRNILSSVRDAQSTAIELDPSQSRMVLLSDTAPEDWTNMTSAMAEAILSGVPMVEAEETAVIQEAIEAES